MYRTVAALLFLATSAAAQDSGLRNQWVALPGYSLTQLLDGPATPKTRKMAGMKASSEIISTDALSWPDGRSALITYAKAVLKGKQGESVYHYRCIDWFNASFEANGFMCYELREPHSAGITLL